jgi:hypothetical protein
VVKDEVALTAATHNRPRISEWFTTSGNTFIVDVHGRRAIEAVTKYLKYRGGASVNVLAPGEFRALDNQDFKIIPSQCVVSMSVLQTSGIHTNNPPQLVLEMLMPVTLLSNRSFSTPWDTWLRQETHQCLDVAVACDLIRFRGVVSGHGLIVLMTSAIVGVMVTVARGNIMRIVTAVVIPILIPIVILVVIGIGIVIIVIVVAAVAVAVIVV